MRENKRERNPMSQRGIFRLTVLLTYLVSGAFLVKNLLGGDMAGAAVVGGILVAFAVAQIGMLIFKVDTYKQRFVVSGSLVLLVFLISLTTGSYYSEDFCLFLAVMCLTGLYLRPGYAWTQLVMSTVCLVILYIAHPEKADPLPQFVMCMITFVLAGALFSLVVSRGRAFIRSSDQRSEEAEGLLHSMNDIGLELQGNFRASTARMDSLETANAQLKDSADILQHGSDSISGDAREVSRSCDSVQQQMAITESNIRKLREDITSFERVLSVNQKNMKEMDSQMRTVRTAMKETQEVFRVLDTQMRKIASVTEEINKIASNTGLLSVNASVEAARAGAAGKGFSVVAANVRELSASSTQCSNEVADVVASMQVQIDKTSRQLAGSAEAIANSLATLQSFEKGFEELTEQFSSLYSNIEAQDDSVTQVSGIFSDLQSRVEDMNTNSEQNQRSVSSIAQTMRLYRENIAAVIEDNHRIRELSENMLEISQRNEEERIQV